jgi:hypothetical protein
LVESRIMNARPSAPVPPLSWTVNLASRCVGPMGVPLMAEPFRFFVAVVNVTVPDESTVADPL